MGDLAHLRGACIEGGMRHDVHVIIPDAVETGTPVRLGGDPLTFPREVMAKVAKGKAKRCEMLAKSRCQHLHVELGGNALPTAGKVRAVVLVDPESDLVVELCPSVKLAAESVGISPTTLRRWCHRR